MAKISSTMETDNESQYNDTDQVQNGLELKENGDNMESQSGITPLTLIQKKKENMDNSLYANEEMESIEMEEDMDQGSSEVGEKAIKRKAEPLPTIKKTKKTEEFEKKEDKIEDGYQYIELEEDTDEDDDFQYIGMREDTIEDDPTVDEEATSEKAKEVATMLKKIKAEPIDKEYDQIARAHRFNNKPIIGKPQPKAPMLKSIKSEPIDKEYDEIAYAHRINNKPIIEKPQPHTEMLKSSVTNDDGFEYIELEEDTDEDDDIQYVGMREDTIENGSTVDEEVTSKKTEEVATMLKKIKAEPIDKEYDQIAHAHRFNNKAIRGPLQPDAAMLKSIKAEPIDKEYDQIARAHRFNNKPIIGKPQPNAPILKPIKAEPIDKEYEQIARAHRFNNKPIIGKPQLNAPMLKSIKAEPIDKEYDQIACTSQFDKKSISGTYQPDASMLKSIKTEKMEMKENQIPKESGRKIKTHEIPELDEAMKELISIYISKPEEDLIPIGSELNKRASEVTMIEDAENTDMEKEENGSPFNKKTMEGVVEIDNGPIQYGVQFNENAIKDKSQQDVAINVDRTVGYEICDNNEIVEDVVNTEPYFVPKELKSLFTIQDVKENMKDVFSAQGRFGFQNISATDYIPYIIRWVGDTGKKYVPLRAIGLYLNKYKDFMATCGKLPAYRVTERETELLDDINVEHSLCYYGSNSFADDEDELIVEMNAAREFFSSLRRTSDVLGQQQQLAEHLPCDAEVQ